MGRLFHYALAAEGKTFATTAKVTEECEAAGFQNVQRVNYCSDTNPDIREITDAAFAAIIEAVYGSLILRSGEVPDQETAEKQAAGLIEKHYSLCAEGLSPPMTLAMVVAQKPLDTPLCS